MIEDIINRIEQAKIANSIFPFHALLQDLISDGQRRGVSNKQTREDLNNLYRQGKITVGDTINDKYIHLKGHDYKL